MTGTRLIVDKDTRTPGDFKRKGVDGAPYVSDPDGAVVKSGARKGEPKWKLYGRPSSLGKKLGDSYRLSLYQRRMVAKGFAVAPDLLEQAAPLVDLTNDDAEFRTIGDAVVAAAERAAKASLAADRGTHGHALTEDHDREGDPIARMEHGETLGIPTPSQHALVEAWRQVLDRYGLEVLATEAKVVNDALRVAGTLDRIVRLTRDLTFGDVTLPAGLVLVLDIKTGKLRLANDGSIAYWSDYAIQTYAYATAVPYDTTTEARTAWPWNVTTDWALICHLDVKAAIDGEARASLVLVDLAAGRHGAELVAAVDAWEARTDIFTIDPDAIVVPVTTTTDNKESDHEGDDQQRPIREDVLSGSGRAGEGVVPGSPGGASTASQPRGGHCDGGSVQPLAGSRAEQLAALPHGTPDEGPDADPADVQAEQVAYALLDADARKWIGELSTSAANWNVPFSMSAASNQPRTARRLAIIAGLVRMCHADAANDDTLRSLLALTVSADWPLFPNVQPGHALGVLGAAEAAQFAAHAEALNHGHLSMTIDDNGTARFGVAA